MKTSRRTPGTPRRSWNGWRNSSRPTGPLSSDASNSTDTIPKGPREYNKELYASGGGWGGAEVPRAVIIEDRIFLSFQAFAGWHSIRIGVTSAPLKQFLAKRWNWSKPAFLSSPHEVNKNWVIFPERINGKFAVLHGIESGGRSKVLIDYVDSLTEDPKQYIKSDPRFRNEQEEGVWDTVIRGAGPPPRPVQDPGGCRAEPCTSGSSFGLPGMFLHDP